MGISLDDLKNDGHEKKQPFVPSIEPLPVDEKTSESVNKRVSLAMMTKSSHREEDIPEERETVSFGRDTVTDQVNERLQREDNIDHNNSLENVAELLHDGVHNHLIEEYQIRKRQQMKEFFQQQKLEKELTGESQFDVSGLEMKFEDDEEENKSYSFRQIDLGAADGTNKGNNRSNTSDSISQKTEETIQEKTEVSGERSERDVIADERQHNGRTSSNDESNDGNVSRNDEWDDGRNDASFTRGNADERGTDINSRESYNRGLVREENMTENIEVKENTQELDNVVEEVSTIEETAEETPVVDSVDYEDTYTHEEGIESIKAGEAAKKEAIAAMEEAKKKSGVTVDMDINRKTSEFKSSNEKLIDDDEIEVSEDDENEDDTDQKERRAIIRSIISEKIKPVAKKMNLQGYTVAKKGTLSNEIFKSKEVPVGHWVLFNTGIAIDIQEIRGIDIERMEEASRLAYRQREMFQIIYDNVVSPKPETLDGWLKSISFNDLDNLMMAIHIGAFADSNYIPIDCEQKTCPKKYFLTDNLPIMNMVEFKDEETKNKFMELYNNPVYNKDGWYTSEIIPISEDFAIGFREPNLYNMVIEINYGEQEFKDAHTRAISAAPFIDNIYQIDKASQQLIPVEWKTWTNNPVKSYKSKILRYDKIISRFTSDELSTMEGLMAEINNRDEYIVYKRPEVVCPYCGAVKKEAKPISMAQTVFSRNQLAALAVSLEN